MGKLPNQALMALRSFFVCVALQNSFFPGRVTLNHTDCHTQVDVSPTIVMSTSTSEFGEICTDSDACTMTQRVLNHGVEHQGLLFFCL